LRRRWALGVDALTLYRVVWQPNSDDCHGHPSAMTISLLSAFSIRILPSACKRRGTRPARGAKSRAILRPGRSALSPPIRAGDLSPRAGRVPRRLQADGKIRPGDILTLKGVDALTLYRVRTFPSDSSRRPITLEPSGFAASKNMAVIPT
jgi:hypothetical protein